jgi:hypothetical protein
MTEEDSVDDIEPPLIIDGKDIWIFTWITFTDIVWDSVLWYTDSGYKFYKLEDLIKHNIK